MNNTLSNVLIRFRQHAHAMTAYIAYMFNQVKVHVKDRYALRFLWMYNDKVAHYRMCSHLFGEVWCPSIAPYTLQDCIKLTNNTTIQNSILNSFYVDDCVASTSNREELL